MLGRHPHDHNATFRTASPRPSGRGLLFYFLGAYALTWLFWVPATLAARGQFNPPVPDFHQEAAGEVTTGQTVIGVRRDYE